MENLDKFKEYSFITEAPTYHFKTLSGGLGQAFLELRDDCGSEVALEI